MTRWDFDAPPHQRARRPEFGSQAARDASAYYSGQSGRPYSIFYTSTDVNGDGVSFNDLFYMPRATDAVTYTNGTYADLLKFMDSESCTKDTAGTVIARNACRTPWTNELDGRFAVALPFKKVKAEITLDALNLLNLFDNKGGQFQYLNFNLLTVFAPTVNTDRHAVTNINLARHEPDVQRVTCRRLRSRWQLQLGGRIRSNCADRSALRLVQSADALASTAGRAFA